MMMDENKALESAEIDFVALLSGLVCPIVDNPDAVSVIGEESESGLVLTLKVAEDGTVTYKPRKDAKVGDIIAIRCTLKSDSDVWASAIIEIKN